uniref:DNA-directed DNA polymerase n=1 Tax=Siphoviridae sp. ctrCN24 TaxID=2827953 RepID=A0A8S5SKC8_9CAUD|nr:MAG TPA: DNA polymerase III, alpha subunit [Siphoviridae sp. ctrCN24]
MSNYTILHCHTMLSNGVTNIDSVTSYDEYVKQAKKWGMKALAFSEHGSVFQWVKKKLCMEESGIKFIAAEEFYLTSTLNEKIRDNYHCLLIAKNYAGALELNKLSSKSFNRDDNSFYYVPRITIDDVKNTSDNIIVSTACLGGVLNKAPDTIRRDFFDWLRQHPDRCFLEIQPHLDPEQVKYNQLLYKLSQQTGLRLLMCTDTHALNAEHVEGRSILQKAKNIHFDGEDKFHLEMLSYNELVDLCKQQNALPMDVYLNSIEMTNIVADMIEPFELDYSYKYPHLWGDDSEWVLRDKIAGGIKWRGVDKLPNYQEYLDRIEYEMKAYIHNGAIDFMLLMEDIITWCKTQGIFVGYGRGSCNGSVIAYLLGITEMDSIKHGLNFDRFMNTERVSLSDIDTDFPPSRINEVKQYIFNKHGLHCSDIVTFNTIAMKGAVRNVGRALGMPLDEVDAICNVAEQDEDGCRSKYPELFKYVDIVNGCVVSVGNHPCGLVCSPVSIDDRMGLFTTSTDDVPISQINMKEVDLQNYVKLDLLKLDTIELINETCKLAGIERLTPDNIDINDGAVWNSIRDDTTCIFQWEGATGDRYIKQLLSDSNIQKFKAFNPDIDYMTLLSVGNGAIRPAGASYRDDLANGVIRKSGNAAIDEFMKPTFGYLVFQCQIIQFLHEYCGYTMGEADVVRRHFAKKIGTDKDIPQIKAGFAKTMSERYNMSQEESDAVIADFIQVIIDASNYLFSLNHSQPYSYEGYVSGWLRYHYPLQFLTVALNINQSNGEKTDALTAYAHKVGITINPPKFRHSRSDYLCDVNSNCIYKGLGSIKYMSSDVAENLYLLRDKQFKNFIDFLFCMQYLPTKPDSRQLDILIKIGYFSEFGKARALLEGVRVFNLFYKSKTIKLDKWIEMCYNVDVLRQHAEKMTDKTASGIDNYALILAILKQESMPKTTIVDMLRWQAEFLGYVDGRDSKRDINDWLVLDSKTTNYGTAWLRLYSLPHGVERQYKCNKKWWATHQCKSGDVIKAVLDDAPKWTKNSNGKFVKTGETEVQVKCFKVLEE